MKWYFEEVCESESCPDCLASITMKRKEEELSFCRNLEMKFHVKINYKNLVAQLRLSLVSIKSTAAKFCWQSYLTS